VSWDQPQRHFGFVDGLRGVAACLVLIEHALAPAGLLSANNRFDLNWLNLGETGVVTFFFVSGFVIPLSLEKWNSISHFWLNRIFRIYPLYIAVYIAAGLLTEFSGLSLAQIPENFAIHLLFIQEALDTPNFIGVAWTLSLEAVWYIGFTLTFVLGWNRNNRLLTMLGCAGALAACLVSLTVLRLPMGRVGLLLVCLLGLLCLRREYHQIPARTFRHAWIAIGLVILAGLAVGFWIRPGNSPLAPSFICVLISWSLAFAIFLAAFMRRNWFVTSNPVSRYLGKISYSIYLVHGMVISLLTAMLAPYHAGPLVMVTAFAVVTIGISALTFHLIELPMIRLAHAMRPVLPR